MSELSEEQIIADVVLHLECDEPMKVFHRPHNQMIEVRLRDVVYTFSTNYRSDTISRLLSKLEEYHYIKSGPSFVME
jgi:hypothetical protein